MALTTVVTLGAAGIAAAAAIIGTWTGNVSGARNEQRQWVRDRAAAALDDYYRAAWLANRAVNRQWDIYYGATDDKPARDREQAAGLSEGLWRAVLPLEIYASDAVAELANGLVVSFDSCLQPGIEREAAIRQREEFGRLLKALRAQIRAELDLVKGHSPEGRSSH